MKLKFWCNSGANIHSCREEEYDLKDYLCCDTDEEALEEWNSMTEEEQYEEAKLWAYEGGLDIGIFLEED